MPMKKTCWFIFFLLLSFSLGFAKEVTRQVASQTALKAIRQQVPNFRGSVRSITPVSYEGVITYYVVNFAPRGWALIAADDAVTPLLGYSPTGSFSTQTMPDNCAGWISNYSHQIVRVVRSDNNTRHKGWMELGKAPVHTRAASDAVAPLIKVNWNQGRPYNKYCPSNGSGTAVVGCVAVAMAQAMSVCAYPPRPVGDYSYSSSSFGTQHINYDNEPAYNWNDILSGANEYDDVARLLWHCGVSVQMDYGIDGSGTQSSYIATALKRNFGYPNSVTYYSRANYTGDWKELIVNELRAGRAVCYNGADLTKGYGHCFNLDGYDGNNMFWVNWGWGGQNNGYFPLDGLKDATMDMDYTAQQGVVVGIRPPSDRPNDIQLSNNIVQEKQPAGTVVAQITVSSEATNPTYEYSLQGPYSPILHDYIDVPFTIENAELKTTEELNASERQEWPIEITVRNLNNGGSYTKQFTIYVVSNEEATVSPASGVTLVYDRNTQLLVMNADRNVSYVIYAEPDDNILDEGELEEGGNVSFPLKNVTAHACKLQLTTVVGSKTIRIILKKEE